jgi:hypothetical protein
MLVFDRVANTIISATKTADGYVTERGELRPFRYIVFPTPQWALEEYADRQAADLRDERDTQESIWRG